MLAEIAPLAADGWRSMQLRFQADGGFVLLFIVNITASWAIWWLWRFVLTPRLFPLEVKEYPYWIPGENFIIRTRFSKMSQAKDKEPLQLTLFGFTMYFISRAEDVTEAYRNTRTLTFDEFYQRVFFSMGTSKESVLKLFAQRSKEAEDAESKQGKPVAQILRELQISQLQPGPNLDSLELAELAYLDSHTQLDSLRTSRYSYQNIRGGDGATDVSECVELSLWHWCTDITTRASQRSLFGSALDRIDPDLPDRFLEFDDLSWKMLYQFPDFLARDLLKKRDYLRGVLKTFCDLPTKERNDAETWVIKSTEESCRNLGIPSEDTASVLLILYWGTNTNTRKAAFWLISHLLQNPTLVDALRTEMAPAFGRDDTIIDLGHLHSRCPQLEAAWNETMRLHGAAASIRTVTADTVIGGRTLRAGRRLVIPYRQLHLEPSIFGEDVKTFRPDRFLSRKTESGERLRLEHFRPFGGGSTICSGRHLVKRMVAILVALLLRRYDISMAGEQQSLPVEDEWRPVLGIADPKPGHDVRIRLTPRKVVP
ncbi:hypothetical protein VMCG_09953 [Cytospora schulzeri]|uniref:Cytochrome P450 n=1 Tax=Cytospora schulzeri TaxID=448051 RepID=A0A423VF04_9PEZI|nr:hypothetical protein VMCG_09953 [Valsa malicola]